MAEYLASWQATMKLLREGKSFSGRERNCAFLNCRGGAFANVSSISGLDFPDDGRAMASVDWDQDGDLDLWFFNRTGPRLRFMRNQTIPNSNLPSNVSNFIAVRLQGTKSNRDAIGARAEVVSAEKDNATLSNLKMVQTLYAGDAYLSQSSKWLHFGLGQQRAIDHIKVRWPNGDVEQFNGVETGKRYHLVEGSGRAINVKSTGPQNKLAAARQESSKLEPASRILLSNRLPMPILKTTDYDNSEPVGIVSEKRPLLINFWASWCGSCVNELKEWTRHRARFENAGVDVLVLSVDELSENSPGSRDNAKRLLEQIRLPFEHALASPDLMDKLTVVQQIALNQQPSFAVPTSLLLDRDGQLAAIYRGPVTVETICDDVSKLDVSPTERRNLSVPFPGRWSSEPRNLLLRPLATVFRDRGYLEDYERYLELDFKRQANMRQNAGSEKERKEIDDEFAAMHFNLARTFESHGNRDEAIEHYRQGLEVRPNDALAHFYLAKTLMQEKDVESAIGHFRKSLEVNPNFTAARIRLGRALHAQGNAAQAVEQYQAALKQGANSAEAHFQLAVSLASIRKPADAVEHFRRAIKIQPDHVDARTNLGAMLAATGKLKPAMEQLTTAIRLDPQHFQARMNLGGALGTMGDFKGAATQYERAVEIQPDSAMSHVRLAQTLLTLADEAAAALHFEKAIELRPSDGASMLRLAWIRATSTDDKLRDGVKAMSLAKQVNDATGMKDPRALDTLAAALAESGEFKLAGETAEQALKNLGNKNPAMSAAIRKRTELYRQRKPFRENR